jgi:hypothetical protein
MRERTVAKTWGCQEMLENKREDLLLVRAEPLERAEEISNRMVSVVRIMDGSLLLEADPA